MTDNIFQNLRAAAIKVAVEFAAELNLEIDEAGPVLIRFSGQWRGLWVFSAVNVGGDLKEVSVMMEPGGPALPLHVRLMAPGIVRIVSLHPFKRRTEALLASRPTSQGQTVSDSAYENAKRDGMPGVSAPSPAPFPHQAE